MVTDHVAERNIKCWEKTLKDIALAKDGSEILETWGADGWPDPLVKREHHYHPPPLFFTTTV